MIQHTLKDINDLTHHASCDQNRKITSCHCFVSLTEVEVADSDPLTVYGFSVIDLMRNCIGSSGFSSTNLFRYSCSIAFD
jgi:hypothetical protein